MRATVPAGGAFSPAAAQTTPAAMEIVTIIIRVAREATRAQANHRGVRYRNMAGRSPLEGCRPEALRCLPGAPSLGMLARRARGSVGRTREGSEAVQAPGH